MVYTATTSDCSVSVNLQSSTSETWETWCATDTTNGVWNSWVLVDNIDGSSNIWVPSLDIILDSPPPDPEQIERERREREETRLRTEQERVERQRQREQADQVAKELLEDCLSEEQLKMFRDLGCFVVISQTGRLYRIKKGRTYNVEELDLQDTEKRIAKLCARPDMRVPDYDTMLAQKLMLETAEDEFRRIANINQVD